MRLKVNHYTNTRSTVFSFALWDTEKHHVPRISQYLRVVERDCSVVDKLHALMLIANEVEKYHAQAAKRKAHIEPVASRESETVRPSESVSL